MLMKRHLLLLLLLIPCSLLQASAKPVTYIWDMSELVALASKPSSQEYKKIIQKADDIIKQKPVAVTDKTTCISGDKHNYESLATYYWPDPDNPQGPYVSKDGYTNPEINQYDFPRLLQLREACLYLSKAFYLTGELKYYRALCNQIDTWFLSKESRMYPNLDYSQVIKGRNNNKGVPGGVLDAYRLVDVIESVLLADHVKSIGRKRRKALRGWLGTLSEWMVESPNGQKARVMTNNHAIAYSGTLLEIALFTKNKSLQQNAIQIFIQNVDTQIDDEGKMPKELSRNNAFTYTIFNLSHIIEVYSMIKSSEYDLPASTITKIQKSALYISSFIGKKETFPYREIGQWESQERNLNVVLRRMTQLGLMKQDVKPTPK